MIGVLIMGIVAGVLVHFLKVRQLIQLYYLTYIWLSSIIRGIKDPSQSIIKPSEESAETCSTTTVKELILSAGKTLLLPLIMKFLSPKKQNRYQILYFDNNIDEALFGLSKI